MHDDLTRRDFTATLLAAAGALLIPRREPSTLADVMVKMRDGIRLATDIYLPSATGRFPVILERTPYNKSAPSRSERTPTSATPLGRAAVADFFVKHGYVVVYQDCRGRYKS